LVLAKVLQIPNVVSFQVQNCMLGQHFGLDTVMGTFNSHDEIVSDYANAKLILSLRSNASLTSASGRTRRLTDGLRNGAKLIVMDPRKSEAATKAQTWLPVKPGTDQAVLLVILNELIKRNAYDAAFLKNHTNAPFLCMAAPQGPMVQMAMKVDEKTAKPVEFYVYDEVQKAVVAVPGPAGSNLKDASGKAVSPALTVPEGLTWQDKPVKTAFQFLSEKVKGFTAGWAAKIADVPAEQITKVANDMATIRPALVDSGWYDVRYTSSMQTWRTAALIQVLLGGVDKEAGWVYNSSTRELNTNFWKTMRAGGTPNMAPGMYGAIGQAALFDTPANWQHGFPTVSKVWSDQQWAAGKDGVAFDMASYAGYPESMLGKLSYNGKPYQLKAVFLTACNPVRTSYSDQTWKEALSSPTLPLVVAFDVEPQDSLLYADVILPDQTYLERGDPLYEAEQSLDRAMVARNPIEPITEGRHMLDIYFELASRFGKYDMYVKAMADFFGWDAAVLKQTVDGARSAGKSIGTPLRDMLIAANAKKMNKPVEQLQKALTEQGVLPVMKMEDQIKEAGIPYVYPAPTPSGRIELYSIFFAGFTKQYGYKPNWDPLLAYMTPDWKPNLKPEDALPDDEFYFTTGHIATMSHTSSADNDLLMALTQEQGLQYSGVWLNPKKASKLGLKTGDSIELENTVSGQKAQGKAYLTELTRPDTIFLASSLGHENSQLTTANGVGTALSKLIPYKMEPVAGTVLTGQFTVKVRKV
jgi:anaerobic selenocysteine-containing dehydrogenase